MGETTNEPFQLSFNTALKVEFQGSRVTSDGGLILVRELQSKIRIQMPSTLPVLDSARVIRRPRTRAGETEGAMSRRRTLVST